jgi:hypothetical protein
MVAALAALFLFLVPTEAFACVRASGAQKPMKDKFWDAVAVCETNTNWKNGGNWAGGLGIYLQTWRGYGGYQFAKTPAKATREEQIIVANRISVHGWQTKNEFRTLQDRIDNKPFFRHAVGFFGWGCIKNRKSLHPSKWGRKKEVECHKKSSGLDLKAP